MNQNETWKPSDEIIEQCNRVIIHRYINSDNMAMFFGWFKDDKFLESTQLMTNKWTLFTHKSSVNEFNEVRDFFMTDWHSEDGSNENERIFTKIGNKS